MLKRPIVRDDLLRRKPDARRKKKIASGPLNKKTSAERPMSKRDVDVKMRNPPNASVKKKRESCVRSRNLRIRSAF